MVELVKNETWLAKNFFPRSTHHDATTHDTDGTNEKGDRFFSSKKLGFKKVCVQKQRPLIVSTPPCTFRWLVWFTFDLRGYGLVYFLYYFNSDSKSDNTKLTPSWLVYSVPPENVKTEHTFITVIVFKT